jgi:hypothetical protein
VTNQFIPLFFACSDPTGPASGTKLNMKYERRLLEYGTVTTSSQLTSYMLFNIFSDVDILVSNIVIDIKNHNILKVS